MFYKDLFKLCYRCIYLRSLGGISDPQPHCISTLSTEKHLCMC